MKKEHFVLPGYLVGLCSLGLITYRTLLAIGTNSKAITVTVNQYGEQYLDVVLLVILWIVCVIGVLAFSSQGKQQKTRASEKYHYRQQQYHTKSLSVPRSSLRNDSSHVQPTVLRVPIVEDKEPSVPLDPEPPLTLSDEDKGNDRKIH
jgi:hypothetical protein